VHVTAIIAAAGSGSRLGEETPKQFLGLGGRSLVQRAVDAFLAAPRITDLIVVTRAEAVESVRSALGGAKPIAVIPGGATRQASVARGMDAVDDAASYVLVHDAARPFVSVAVIDRVLDAAITHGAAIAALPATDTIKRVDGGRILETIPRETIFLAQTPQGFRRDVLAKAVALGRAGADGTDEAALAERAGYPVHVVAGDDANVKITTPGDLSRARRSASTARTLVGTGYDLHTLVAGRPLLLGGVEVPAERGAFGHSDADVACHALTDAILGAAAMGDIGRHFPDTDPAWKGASSVDLLARAAELVRRAGYAVVNVDVTIVLQRPKIAPFIDAIRAGLAQPLGVPVERVSVKGKTNEGVDAVGRGEAIAAHAIALLEEGA
jgi:2-C-methyl-D-erythritol 4-phosphate cytidylyltransferase/2-C-methyl-D-erythritol 2,4-cyclodiphosphate synthase